MLFGGTKQTFLRRLTPSSPFPLVLHQLEPKAEVSQLVTSVLMQDYFCLLLCQPGTEHMTTCNVFFFLLQTWLDSRLTEEWMKFLQNALGVSEVNSIAAKSSIKEGTGGHFLKLKLVTHVTIRFNFKQHHSRSVLNHEHPATFTHSQRKLTINTHKLVCSYFKFSLIKTEAYGGIL